MQARAREMEEDPRNFRLEPRGPAPLQCGPSPARSQSQEGRGPRAGTVLGSESGQRRGQDREVGMSPEPHHLLHKN